MDGNGKRRAVEYCWGWERVSEGLALMMGDIWGWVCLNDGDILRGVTEGVSVMTEDMLWGVSEGVSVMTGICCGA